MSLKLIAVLALGVLALAVVLVAQSVGYFAAIFIVVGAVVAGLISYTSLWHKPQRRTATNSDQIQL